MEWENGYDGNIDRFRYRIDYRTKYSKTNWYWLNLLQEILKLHYLISSAFTSIVVSLGSLKFSKFFRFISSKCEPQLMQVLLIPKETVPHLLQVFNFDFKELKLINTIKNIKRGIKNTSNKRFPMRLTKKLNPKRGITIKKIKE